MRVLQIMYIQYCIHCRPKGETGKVSVAFIFDIFYISSGAGTQTVLSHPKTMCVKF